MRQANNQLDITIEANKKIYLYPKSVTDSQGITWTYLGHGNFNVVYQSSPLAENLSVNGIVYPKGMCLIYKEPFEIDDKKLSVQANRPKRAVRVLNEIWEKCYPGRPKSAEYSLNIKKNEGLIMTFVQGENSVSQNVCEELVRIYNLTGRVIVDSIIPGNFKTCQSGSDQDTSQPTSIDNTFAVKVLKRSESEESLALWTEMKSTYDDWFEKFEKNEKYKSISDITKALLYLTNFPEIKDASLLLEKPDLVEALNRAYEDADDLPPLLFFYYFEDQLPVLPIPITAFIDLSEILLEKMKNDRAFYLLMQHIWINLNFSARQKNIINFLAARIPSDLLSESFYAVASISAAKLKKYNAWELAVLVVFSTFPHKNKDEWLKKVARKFTKLSFEEASEIISFTTDKVQLYELILFLDLLEILNVSSALKAMQSLLFDENLEENAAILSELVDQSNNPKVLKLISNNEKFPIAIRDSANAKQSRLSETAISRSADRFFQPVKQSTVLPQNFGSSSMTCCN